MDKNGKNSRKYNYCELDKADCIQAEFPKYQPRKIWEQSGRWEYIQKNLI